MILKIIKKYFFLLIFLAAGHNTFGQSVPKGIFYQAVARDNYGKELVNKDIDVKFSIISGTPLGTIVFQELHSHVITSKYGVFTRVIGTGTNIGGVYEDLSQIQWSQADHFLKVEVKFDNDFLDMGTMQFLTVPYALYAQKSLEAGPAGPPGPKGETGDPATDSQTLSFNGNNLAISGGNTVNLSSLNIPHQLSLLGDTLSILGGNKVGLTNQIQDLALDINNKLKITKNSAATEIDLSPFKQNLTYNSTAGIISISNGTAADISILKQSLSYDPSTRKLGISGVAGIIDLSKLMQVISFNESTNTLTISDGNSVPLGSLVAFRAKKITEETGLSINYDYDFITPVIEYNDGSGFDGSLGIFTAPVGGIYTFNIGYSAVVYGDSKTLKLFLNGSIYETLNSNIALGSSLSRSITMKLVAGDKIKIVFSVATTYGTVGSGTGSFSGYKVY